MKNKKLLIFISVLVLIFIFSVAAICNTCAAFSRETADAKDQEAENSEDIAGEIDSGARIDEDNSGTARQGEDDDLGATDNTGSNSNPVIDAITISSPGSGIFIDVMNPAVLNALQTMPKLWSMQLNIDASDADNDDLSYYVSDSLGNNLEVTKQNNNKAESGFISPEDAGPYTVGIRVTDGRGGEASYSVDMRIIDETEDVADEDVAETVTGTAYISPYANLSGYIVQDTALIISSDSVGAPLIYFGDSAGNKQVKGYLSFDIRELHGKTLTDARINSTRLERIGNPNFAEYIDIKAYNYGNSLGFADFAVGGTMLTRLVVTPPVTFGMAGDALKNELRRVLDTPSNNYFQLKIGLSSAVSNNSAFDGFNLYLGDLELYISYVD